MTAGKNKGIVSVEYDDRNMPKRITFTSGQTTEYTYSTDGRKWRVSYGFGSAPVTAPMLTVMDGGSELMAADNRQTVDYCGNVIYRNGQLERILIEGGYITYESGSYKYHYYIKDHLGNNRVVIDDNKAVEQVVHYYPFGAQFLDGMGTDAQPYKYNGKELDRMNGLDWYDYGARFYDASIGRWGTIDPLAEKYYDISPYAYCHNNPINRFDLDGKDDYFSNNGRFLYSRGTGPTMYVSQNGRFVDFRTIDLRVSSNMQMAAKIIGHYAKMVGVSYNMNGGNGTVGVSTLHHVGEKGMRILAATSQGNIWVKIKYGKLDSQLYNIYALMGTLRHENEHKKDQIAEKGKASNLRHAEIMLTEMKHDDFKNTPFEYQEGILGQFFEYLREAWKEADNKYSEEEINKITNLRNKGDKIRKNLGIKYIYN